jgi:hypothetical protein
VDQWITRFAALLCAAGSCALFWSFGMFVAVPWHDGHLLSMNAVEMQVVGIPLVAALAVGWGALHLLTLDAEGRDSQGKWRARIAIFALLAIAASAAGASWSLARIV